MPQGSRLPRRGDNLSCFRFLFAFADRSPWRLPDEKNDTSDTSETLFLRPPSLRDEAVTFPVEGVGRRFHLNAGCAGRIVPGYELAADAP